MIKKSIDQSNKSINETKMAFEENNKALDEYK